ncbi:hypothetical protein NKH77_19685 [Streptomyces sp. M19]
MGAEEKELFTPALQAELLVLSGCSRHRTNGSWSTSGTPAHPGHEGAAARERADDPDFLHHHKQRLAAEAEQRERDRREVEGIARASGMEP